MAADCGRIGPESVNDTCIDLDLSVYGHNTKVSREKDTPGMAIAAGAWYLVPDIVDVGLQAVVLDWGQGGFLSVRRKVQNDFSVSLGLGVLGYKFESNTKQKYYTHEPTLLLNIGYQTTAGEIVVGYLVTETKKTEYGQTTSIENDVGPAHWEDPEPTIVTTATENRTRKRTHTIGVGYRVRY